MDLCVDKSKKCLHVYTFREIIFHRWWIVKISVDRAVYTFVYTLSHE